MFGKQDNSQHISSLLKSIEQPVYLLNLYENPADKPLMGYIVSGFKDNPGDIAELSRDAQAGEVFDGEHFTIHRLTDDQLHSFGNMVLRPMNFQEKQNHLQFHLCYVRKPKS
jgi:hypothetical protein